MDCIVLLYHRQHVPLRVIGGPLADTLGSCGGGKPSFKTQPAFQRMERTHALLQRFIEAAPYVHRAKKWRHRVTIFPTSAIAPSLKRQVRRCLGVVVGLHMIQDLSAPFHKCL
jgi:hypothetical protein